MERFEDLRSAYDYITTEMTKFMRAEATNYFLQLINRVWLEETMPKDWEIGIILPIFMKGDSKECSNYRGISLLSTALKTYERVLKKRLITIEPTLIKMQSGFRRGLSTQDHIFTLKEIRNRTIEYNKKAYLAFVNSENAFDQVPRESIWKNLLERGVEEKLVEWIQSLYQEN